MDKYASNIINSFSQDPWYYLTLGAYKRSPQAIKITHNNFPLIKQLYMDKTCRTFVIIGACSAALAHVLAAYGAHKIHGENIEDNLKKIYDTANTFQFYSSFSLMLVPFSRKPLLSGMLLLMGMLGFSGSCYMYTFLQLKSRYMITPIGAMLTTFGLLSFVL